MTEEEAQKRWCPFAGSRIVSNPPVGQMGTYFVGPGGMNVTPYCLASACMAWRRDRVENLEGHCGLAGPL